MLEAGRESSIGLSPPIGGERYVFEIDFFGLRYRGHLGSHIDRQVYFFGAYERDELDFVRAWWGGRPGGVALDVGANVGHHTLVLSQIFATVHAFEPNPDPLAELEQKISQNQIANVVVHRFGLWERAAELTFNIPPRSNTGMGSFKEAIDSMAITVPLHVRCGDDVLEESGIEHIDFVKIDVQGAEKEVLSGLRKTLQRSHPLVWIEISETTRHDFSTVGSVFDCLGQRRYEALSFSRRWPWLNVMMARTIDARTFKAFEGNLFLRPI